MPIPIAFFFIFVMKIVIKLWLKILRVFCYVKDISDYTISNKHRSEC